VLEHLALAGGQLLERIVAALPDGRRIQVGAEDAARTDRTHDVLLPLARTGAPLGATVQANLRRSDRDADRLAEAGLHIRLVKGAYVEPPEVARPFGDETDLAFVDLAHRLAGAPLALATHDRPLRTALLHAIPSAECELLLGVRNEDADALAADGRTVRLYIPYGEAWFRYWMRRVAESRGA
jgi:proline dehydrogenase